MSLSILEQARAAYAREGLAPQTWSNAPGYEYGGHDHPYDKVLICVEGSITFHTPDADIDLVPGSRLDLPAGTAHSATVGPEGVTCMEAHRR